MKKPSLRIFARSAFCLSAGAVCFSRISFCPRLGNYRAFGAAAIARATRLELDVPAKLRPKTRPEHEQGDPVDRSASQAARPVHTSEFPYRRFPCKTGSWKKAGHV
jgi:hypothetical protein